MLQYPHWLYPPRLQIEQMNTADRGNATLLKKKHTHRTPINYTYAAVYTKCIKHFGTAKHDVLTIFKQLPTSHLSGTSRLSSLSEPSEPNNSLVVGVARIFSCSDGCGDFVCSDGCRVGHSKSYPYLQGRPRRCRKRSYTCEPELICSLVMSSK